MSKPPPESPNLLFVFADQMRGQDMNCAGNAQMVTPTFDRMAREGVRCAKHFATTPICCPNRATMFTGTYPNTHGVMFNDHVVRTDLPSMGTIARDHGYRTGYVGKWHMDAPRDVFIPPGPRRLGFDDYWAVYNCAHDYFDARYFCDTPELIREEGYEPEVQTRLACEFLDGCDDDDRPFCLAVSFGPPHDPYEQVPDRYREMYPDPETLELRPNVEDAPREWQDPNWSMYPTTRDYWAQITSLDEMLGIMLDKLDAIGAADNTIVVFASDHGDMMYSHGRLLKCMPYEESLLVPLLVRWPAGLRAGGVCESLIGTVDLLPTLCGLCGWDAPDTLAGVDCAPNVHGDAGASEQAQLFHSIYTAYAFRKDRPAPEWRGLRTTQYTYAARPDRSCWMLFDNDADPYQMKNLAESDGHTALRESLAADLEQWLKRIGDPFLPTREQAAHFGIDYLHPRLHPES